MQQRFETFTVLIAKISRSIRRIKAEEMSEFHLKGPHVSCLYYLTQLGPLTAGQLCDRCEEDKAAVSRSLEYLEQNGYVTRPDKRYRSPLTLTEKGQETGRAIAGKIDRLVEELKRQGGKAHGAVADVTSEEEWKTIVERIVSESGRLDVVVNNAGINIRKPIEEMVKDEWMKMMEGNTASVFLATKYVLPVMRKQGGGAIINTSSICGLIGHMNTPEAYTATKGAITLLTKSVAARYGKDNIRCNSIHPATVDTPFVAALMADPVKKQARLNEIPLGRLTSVEDVANAVLYRPGT